MHRLAAKKEWKELNLKIYEFSVEDLANLRHVPPPQA